MDALNEHLESLASLGTLNSRGAFSLARDQVWERLRQALPDGNGSLRFLLRWLHVRGASEVRIRVDRPHSLSVIATLSEPALLPASSRGEELDLAGHDIDLARATVGSKLLGVALRWELDDGESCFSCDFSAGDHWQVSPSTQSGPAIRATYTFNRQQWPRVAEWEQSVKKAFRCSPISLRWNEDVVSGPYSFDVPVLVWRHLRPAETKGSPLLVTAPRTAVESFRAARPIHADVVLGMMMGFACSERSEIELLRQGELLALPEAGRELAGFAGMIRDDDHPLDLEGARPVWNTRMQGLVSGFADEAVDMAVQLFHRQPPLEPRQAESIFLGMQSVLLHLLTHQRFTEGHLLAEWLRERMGDGGLLKGFRAGYTFDRICALLAEPAGHPQTALRWTKSADARVRQQTSRQPEVVDEALQIVARLELRARRNQENQLSGDTQGRLSQLAFRLERRGRYQEAADLYLMLGTALSRSNPDRMDILLQAARCGELAGMPYYSGVVARERTAAAESPREGQTENAKGFP